MRRSNSLFLRAAWKAQSNVFKKIMKFLFCLLLIPFVCESVLYGQTSKATPENEVIGVYDPLDGDFTEITSRIKDKLMQDFNVEDDRIAIVICSPDPLPVALAMSAGSPINFALEMEQKGNPHPVGEGLAEGIIPRANITFLRRTRDCVFVKNKPGYSEYWIVRKGNELPEFVEAAKASNFSQYDIILGNDYYENNRDRYTFYQADLAKEAQPLTPQIYKQALAKTAEVLKQHRTAFAVINTYYYGRFPNKTVLSNIFQARNFLEKSGIGDYRIFVRRINLGNDAAANNSGNKYPDITVVFEN